MLQRIFAHWKTTAAGIGVAAFGVILNGRNPHAFYHALAIAVLGALAKD